MDHQSFLREILLLFSYNMSIILKELPDILDSDYFSITLSITGVLFGVSDNYNKALSQRVEEIIVYLYHKVVRICLMWLALFLCFVAATSIYDHQGSHGITLGLWYLLVPAARIWIVFSIVISLLAVVFAGLIYVIDLGRGNILATLSLTLVSAGSYFEMKDSIPQALQLYFFGAVLAVVFLIVVIGGVTGGGSQRQVRKSVMIRPRKRR